jgi:PhoH-like ATPase
MKTKLLLDTNIILDKSIDFSLFSTNKYEIFITDKILSELDRFKESNNQEIKFLSDLFFKLLSNNYFKKTKKEVISTDIIYSTLLDFKSLIPIEFFLIDRTDYKSINNEFSILEIAKDYNLTLITNDSVLRIKALMANIENKSMNDFLTEQI